MAISNEFGIDYNNKLIYHASGVSTYTVNALYSYLQDTFDELEQMDDGVPMSAATPTSYTMINGWYMEEEVSKYLYGGAIQTNGYTDEVRTLICVSGTWTEFDTDAIGESITGDDSGDTGILLDYDNAAYKLWIRMDAAGDIFDDVDEAFNYLKKQLTKYFINKNYNKHEILYNK